MTSMTPLKLIYKSVHEDGSHSYGIFLNCNGSEKSTIVTVAKRHLNDRGLDDPAIESELNCDENESLLEAVKDFDKAGHILTFECGPIVAEPPLTLPPPMRPVELEYLFKPEETRHHFAVVMEHPDKIRKQYIFPVSDEPYVNLQYPKEFFKDLGGCMDLAAPLFDAIRKFYIAGRPDLD